MTENFKSFEQQPGDEGLSFTKEGVGDVEELDIQCHREIKPIRIPLEAEVVKEDRTHSFDEAKGWNDAEQTLHRTGQVEPQSKIE